MRHIGLPLLAVSSLLLAGLATAATRPRYGSTLRVAMRAAPTSLDPADSSQPDSLARRNLARLMFDTLVTLDDRGRPQPALASSWQSEPGNQRWQFYLRRAVQFYDGSPLTSDAVAASLRAANPSWKVFPLGDAVVIERDTPTPNLPAELALPHNSIVKRNGKLLGTGPFAIADWQPGKKLMLTARDEYWGGRPFVDSIQVEMSRNFREQMISLDLGKTDVIEVAPEQSRRAAAEGRRIAASAPVELMALVFTREREPADDGHLREALKLSIDRDSIKNVLLQGEGEPADGILPNWMTGYAFLFPAGADVQHARQLRAEARQVPARTLSYDAGDPLARVVAERITLNARDAGIVLQPVTGGTADLRLVRIPLASLDARLALTEVAMALGLGQPKLTGSSAEDLYFSESALLQSQRIIPVLHLSATYGLNGSVKNWNQDREGSWRLEDAWVGAEKP